MAAIRKRTWKTPKGETRVAFSVNVEGEGSRSRRQFATRREAEAYRVDAEHQRRTGTYRADAANVRISEVADQFLDHCKGRWQRGERMTQQNFKVYEGHVRNYICPDATRHAERKPNRRLIQFVEGISSVKLAQLTPGRVGDFRDRLRSAGVSVVTTRKILGTLLQLLNYAISRDFIAVNAARGVKVIGRRDEGAKKIVPPTKETVCRLLEVAGEDFRIRLLFASVTGVRAGELHALRWRHIDFDAGEVTVETRVDAYGDEDVTKTAAGMRTVPLAQPLAIALKAWKLRTTRKQPDDLVFPNEIGTYTNHSDLVKRKFLPLFAKLAALHAQDPTEHAPPPPRFNWHALRHFAISCWIEADLKPKTVQTFAGHSSLQVTMDRYGHLFKSDNHRAAMDAIAASLIRG
jgi:integrase